MITVRASTVESFRLYRDPDLDFISAAGMEARLRGLDEVDDEARARMDLGTAFHSAVETFDLYEPDDRETVTVDGHTFSAEMVLRAKAGLEGAVPEAEGRAIVDVGGVLVQLTGHADWLRGLDMTEFKTSQKPIKPDRHAMSMQWRCYCLLFGVVRVTYRQIQLATDRQGVVYARSIEDVVSYRYPKLRDDVVLCLADLLAFARVRGCLDAMDGNRAAANDPEPVPGDEEAS